MRNKGALKKVTCAVCLISVKNKYKFDLSLKMKMKSTQSIHGTVYKYVNLPVDNTANCRLAESKVFSFLGNSIASI